MVDNSYDVVIVGAGPAGCAAAYQLAGKGIKIAVIDKATFPRDKICGDALSADVINQFYRMDPGLAMKFESFAEKQGVNGVRFYAPNSSKLDMDFQNPNHDKAAGYVAKRSDFDRFWFNQITRLEGVSIFLEQEIKDIETTEKEISVETRSGGFVAKILLAADGAQSICRRLLTSDSIEKDHHCAGLRQYYQNVDFPEGQRIELHFYKELLPGYFWIFPLPNNQANVGLGILSSVVSKKRLNLKSKLEEVIANHPHLSSRFKNATPLEEPKGFGLPIGSKKRVISGDRFLLLGDAASLIDPFTGEGIGNAIRSGRLAAEHVAMAMAENDFSAKFNQHYDQLVYSKMWKELRVSRSMQNLLKYPQLFNFIVRKANNNQSIRTLLTSMLDNIDLKQELVRPRFYWKLLVGG